MKTPEWLMLLPECLRLAEEILLLHVLSTAEEGERSESSTLTTPTSLWVKKGVYFERSVFKPCLRATLKSFSSFNF